MSQFFRWRKELSRFSAASVPQLVAVEVAEALPALPTPLEPPLCQRPRKKASILTIELGGGRRLRVESDVDTQALARIFWIT